MCFKTHFIETHFIQSSFLCDRLSPGINSTFDSQRCEDLVPHCFLTSDDKWVHQRNRGSISELILFSQILTHKRKHRKFQFFLFYTQNESKRKTSASKCFEMALCTLSKCVHEKQRTHNISTVWSLLWLYRWWLSADPLVRSAAAQPPPGSPARSPLTPPPGPLPAMHRVRKDAKTHWHLSSF